MTFERVAHPYRDTDVIDSRAPRFNQAVIGTLSVVAVATGAWWVLALLAAQLAVGLVFGRRFCLPRTRSKTRVRRVSRTCSVSRCSRRPR
jgi:uncharacterized protein DUF4395